MYYFSEILYLGSLTMIRISILCFYLRIFPQRTFRRIVYVVIAGNAAYGISFISVSIFQCIPVQGAWTRWDGVLEAKCVNINAVVWTCAAINIALDFLVLILPMRDLARLAMPWDRKIYVLLVFCLGFLYVFLQHYTGGIYYMLI